MGKVAKEIKLNGLPLISLQLFFACKTCPLTQLPARRAFPFSSLVPPLPPRPPNFILISFPTHILFFSFFFRSFFPKYPTTAPLAQPLVVLEKKRLSFILSFKDPPSPPPPLLSSSFYSPSSSSSSSSASFCAYAYKLDEASSYRIIKRVFFSDLIGWGGGVFKRWKRKKSKHEEKEIIYKYIRGVTYGKRRVVEWFWASFFGWLGVLYKYIHMSEKFYDNPRCGIWSRYEQVSYVRTCIHNHPLYMNIFKNNHALPVTSACPYGENSTFLIG